MNRTHNFREQYSHSNVLDFFISTVIVSIIYLTLFIFDFKVLINENLFIVILQILIGLLTVIVTVLAILYAISDFIKDNPFIVELKRKNLYSQLFLRFIDSIKAIFVSSIIVFLIYLFCMMPKSFPFNNIDSIFSFITLIFFSFSLLRAYRCFKVLKILHGIVNYKPEESNPFNKI